MEGSPQPPEQATAPNTAPHINSTLTEEIAPGVYTNPARPGSLFMRGPGVEKADMQAQGVETPEGEQFIEIAGFSEEAKAAIAAALALQNTVKET